MTSPLEILARRRAAIIAEQEGRTASFSAHEAQKEAALVRAAETEKWQPESTRLRFSKHARLRMSQFGLSARDVYALWRKGDRSRSGEHAAYRLTRSALAVWPDDPRLRRMAGATLIVAGEDSGAPTLVTVLPYGPDTRFPGMGRSPKRRRRKK